jgi:CRISPR system Cascade subunit CasD
VTTLLFNLSAPLQAWGDSSRFVERRTRPEPTKSGVVGLLAAALGRRRTDPIEDLAGLEFGVRTDQAGVLQRELQTETDWRTGKPKPLTHRYYLADARFVAAVSGPEGLIGGLHDALRNPTFPLYLGRRSCPPAGPIYGVLDERSLKEVLHSAAWSASLTHQQAQARQVGLPIVRDVRGDDSVPVAETIRDYPVSFDPEGRIYGWRDVVHEQVLIDNPESKRPVTDKDWLAVLGGS